MRRIWVRLLGGALWLPALWPPIKWAIKKFFEIGEHVEFIAVLAREFSEVGRMIDSIPEVPQWIGVPLLLVGLILVWWDNRRRAMAVQLPTASVSPIAAGTVKPKPASKRLTLRQQLEIEQRWNRTIKKIALVVGGMLVVIGVVVTAIYNSASPNFSKMQVVNIEAPIKNDPIQFNYYIKNVGQISAIGTIQSDTHVVSDKEMTDSEVDLIFDIIKLRIKNMRAKEQYDHETEPEQIIWHTANDRIPQSEFSQVMNGPKFLYGMVYWQYRDRNTPAGKWRVTEHCMLTYKGQVFFNGMAWHTCRHHNRIYLSD